MEKKTIWDLNRITPDSFKTAPKVPIVMVLDNIRSLSNVGAILRTCDAFAVERVLLCGVTGTPPSPEIHKTALGAEDSVDWTYCDDTLEAVRQLKRDGYTVCSLEIPQFGTKHSLNVSVSAGIALWQLFAHMQLRQ